MFLLVPIYIVLLCVRMAADENVVTGIDTLFKYVNERGETDIPALAGALGASEQTIQSWSTVLEKSGLVKITYKLGKMYVSPLTESIRASEVKAGETTTVVTAEPVRYEKLTAEEVDKLNQVKSSILNDSIVIQNRAADQLEPQIKALRNYISQMQKEFKDKSAEFKSYTAELNAFRAEANKSFESIGSSRQSLDKLVSELNIVPGTAQSQESIVNNLDTISKNTEALIEDIRSKASGMSGFTDEMIRQFEQKTSEERKKLIAFSESVKEESKRLDAFSQTAEQQLSTYKKEAEAYKRSFEKYLSRASKDRETFIDRYTRAQSSIDALYGNASKKFNSLDLMLSNQAVELNKVGSVEQKLDEMRRGVDEIEKQKEQLKKELDLFSKQLQELSRSKKTGADKGRLVREIDEKTKGNAKKLKELNAKLGVTSEELADIVPPAPARK